MKELLKASIDFSTGTLYNKIKRSDFQLDKYTTANLAVIHSIKLDTGYITVILSGCCTSRIYTKDASCYCSNCGKKIDYILHDYAKFYKKWPTYIWENPEKQNVRMVVNTVIYSVIPKWKMGVRKEILKQRGEQIQREAVLNNWKDALKVIVFPKPKKSGLTYKTDTGRTFLWGTRAGRCIDVSYHGSYAEDLSYQSTKEFIDKCIKWSKQARPQYSKQFDIAKEMSDTTSIFTILRWPNLLNMMQTLNYDKVKLEKPSKKIRQILSCESSGPKLVKNILGLSKAVVNQRQDLHIVIKYFIQKMFPGEAHSILSKVNKFEDKSYLLISTAELLKYERAAKIVHQFPKFKHLIKKEMEYRGIEHVITTVMDICNMYLLFKEQDPLVSIPIKDSLKDTEQSLIDMIDKHLVIKTAKTKCKMVPRRFNTWFKDNYVIAHPNTIGDLGVIASDQHHCLYGYSEAVMTGTSSIMLVYNEDGKIEATLEIKDNTITQSKASCNRRPNEEVNSIIDKWGKEHKLLRNMNEYYVGEPIPEIQAHNVPQMFGNELNENDIPF